MVKHFTNYSQQRLFWARFGPFLPKFEQTGFFPKKRAPSLLTLYGPLTSCKRSEKTLEPILRKSLKTSFLGYFGPFLPKFGQTGFFPKNRAPSLFSIYESLTSCKRSEKTSKHERTPERFKELKKKKKIVTS